MAMGDKSPNGTKNFEGKILKYADDAAPGISGGLLVLFLLGMTAMRLAASYVSLVSGGAENSRP